jgi:hypothetical protein
MYTFADCGNQVGLNHSDVAGVLYVEEWFEPNHEVGREIVRTPEGDNRPSAVWDELTVALYIRHNTKHLVARVSNYFLLAEHNAFTVVAIIPHNHLSHHPSRVSHCTAQEFQTGESHSTENQISVFK